MTLPRPRAALAAVAVLCAAAAARSQTVAIPAPPLAQPVFSAKSELVVLHVSVEDSRRRYVAGLGKDAFTVFENGEAQQVEMFSGEDVPATIGVLIDNSASMRPSRERVVAAALAFTETSHPEDEIFVLTFNEHVRHAWGPVVVSQTSPSIFKATMNRAITAAGMTAVYDAITEGLRRVRRGIHTRQVLIVISDGSDNASKAKEADVIQQVRDSDATVYAVGLIDPVTRGGNPGLLRRLTKATGGTLFQPKRADDIPAVLETIARDIRSAYTLAYAPSRTTPDGVRRMIRVQARSPQGRLLSVRSRDGYFLKTITGGAHD
jgi:Ca-activated chloride channel family protein